VDFACLGGCIDAEGESKAVRASSSSRQDSD
jgi:hypothetical protein